MRVALDSIAPRRAINPETRKPEGEHAVVVGITGGGKTFLVRRLMRRRTFVAFHDPKGTFHDRAFKRCERLKDVFRFGNRPERFPKITYAPERKELRDRGAIEAYCEWLYVNRNRLAAFDEVTAITRKNGDLPDAYVDMLSRGREYGIEVLSGTQQPVFVENIVFTQSRNSYIFFTNLDAHRRKIASLMPIDADAIESLSEHQFYYYRIGERAALGPMRLEDLK